jgi:hypothetical protein
MMFRLKIAASGNLNVFRARCAQNKDCAMTFTKFEVQLCVFVFNCKIMFMTQCNTRADDVGEQAETDGMG